MSLSDKDEKALDDFKKKILEDETEMNMDRKPSHGYFRAKRQMQDTLDNKLGQLLAKKKKLTDESNYTGLTIVLIQIDQLESIRDYVRNGMLWDTRNGK